ncbi:Friend virus susceptibility protein 1-like [Lacerta agilis]|uniref:Friend virus susceptibility protein 1-like n=1 Tax=Lacerta agilis TaxID=80427 RepID=UPI001419E87B|nr:Friend virus susceptibility protein 1-like [Lacerta agilis]
MLNWLTLPVFWDSELDEFGGPTPDAVLKCLQLAGIEGGGQKAVTGLGWILLTVLCEVWEQLEATQGRVRQQMEEMAVSKDQQALLREALERARGRGDVAEGRATTMAIRFAKLKHCQQARKGIIPSPYKVRALVASRDWNPETWDGDNWDSGDDECEWTEDEEGDESTWVAAARPLITNKSKGPPGNPQATQTTRIVRDCTQQELADVARNNRQNPGERLSQWLVRLWDQGASSIYFTAGELIKLGTLTRDTMINQYLRTPNPGAAASLFEWVAHAVRTRYPAIMDWEEQMPLWHTIDEAVEQLRGMAMQTGLYLQGFVRPDVQCFTAEMRARVMKGAPPHMRGPLLALLGPAQGIAVGEVVVLLSQLGEVHRENVAKPRTRAAREGEKFQEVKSRQAKKPADKVTRRQMFMELLKAGVPKVDIDGMATAEI